MSYKSSSLTGLAANNTAELARSVQAFMITSLFGPWDEIVALFLVKDINSDMLVPLIKQTIQLVQSCGFVVLVITCDNIHINGRAFQQLCGSRPLELGTVNPQIGNQ